MAWLFADVWTAMCVQGYFKPTIVKLMSDLAGGRHKCIRQMKVRVDSKGSDPG